MRSTPGTVVLGVHSNLDGSGSNTSSPGSSSRPREALGNTVAEYTAGHAWISVSRDGVTTTYGLWPDSHPAVPDNGDASDVRIGMEPATGAANRYYKLTKEQANKLENLLLVNVKWKYTTNCSSWASHVAAKVLGVDIDADDWLGFETPRELGRNITKLEKKQPTSPKSPAVVKPKKSWW